MELKKINLLIELESALIDLHDSKAISDRSFYEQLIPIIYDYVIGDENELAITVVQQIDLHFLQALKKHKTAATGWEYKAYTIYLELGLEFCMPTFTEIKN